MVFDVVDMTMAVENLSIRTAFSATPSRNHKNSGEISAFFVRIPRLLHRCVPHLIRDEDSTAGSPSANRVKGCDRRKVGTLPRARPIDRRRSP
ncbi:unnamed protein product, partial [Iphiclides podalirius]